MFTDIIVLAGGYGKRLWPASMPHSPKQFIRLESGYSFLQTTLLHCLNLCISGKILVVTSLSFKNLILEHCTELLMKLPAEKKQQLLKQLVIIFEPSKKNTAAAVILGCHWLLKNRKTKTCSPNVLLMTSDHCIEPEEVFIKDAEHASQISLADKFVCFVIKATRPETGYGYIQCGKLYSEQPCKTWHIEHFIEKPSSEQAKKYFQQGNYCWNSGMYGFKADFLLAELDYWAPEFSSCFTHLSQDSTDNQEITSLSNSGLVLLENWPAMDRAYQQTPNAAIANLYAEKTKKGIAVPAHFNWEDIGSWDTLRTQYSDHQGIATQIDSQGCFVYSDIPVALCGVSDLIVVIKNERALIVKKGMSHLVGEAANNDCIETPR